MTLQTELQTDPLNRGYAQFFSGQLPVIVSMMNDRSYTMVKTKFVTARTVLAEHGEAGATVLDKLDAAKTSDPAVKWAMAFVTSDPGIDVGHPTTRSMLDSLAAANVLTSTEASLLKDMAIQPASRAEVLGLPFVTITDVVGAVSNG
jgi:hypothetical protein